MAHAAAEELGGIPMSASLQTTLLRAREYAAGQSQAEVSLEHLLLALTEDEDAAAVLQSCDVDLARLRNDVASYLGSTGESAPPGRPPAISPGLTQILKYATLAAKQGRRPNIDGAIVLAAIVGDGRSMAAGFLKAQGLTFQATVRVLQQATRDSRAAPPSAPVRSPAGPSPAPLPPPSQPAMPPSAHEPRPAPALQQPVTATPARAPQPEPPAQPAPRPPVQHPHDAEDILAAARARVVSRLPQGPITADLEAEPAAPITGPPHQNGYAPPSDVPARPTARVVPLPAAQPPELPPAAPASTWTPPPLPSPPAGGLPQPPGVRPPLAPLAPHGRGPAPAAPSPFPPLGAPPAQPLPAGPPPSAPVPPPWGTPHDDGTGPPEEPAPGGWSPHATPRPGPYAPASMSPRVPAVDSSQISHSIPRHMTIGKPLTIEVSIDRPPLTIPGGPSRPARDRRDVVTARAVSVRLRPAKGRFVIDQPSAETQWDKASEAGRLQTDAAVWRFVVVPQSQGASELVLMVAARTIAADGVIVETALPDQIVPVRVGRDWRRTLHSVAMLALIGIASVVIGQLIDDVPGFDLIKRLRAMIGL